MIEQFLKLLQNLKVVETDFIFLLRQFKESGQKVEVVRRICNSKDYNEGQKLELIADALKIFNDFPKKSF